MSFDKIIREAMNSDEVRDVLRQQMKQSLVNILKGIIEAMKQTNQHSISLESLENIVEKYQKESK